MRRRRSTALVCDHVHTSCPQPLACMSSRHVPQAVHSTAPPSRASGRAFSSCLRGCPPAVRLFAACRPPVRIFSRVQAHDVHHSPGMRAAARGQPSEQPHTRASLSGCFRLPRAQTRGCCQGAHRERWPGAEGERGGGACVSRSPPACALHALLPHRWRLATRCASPAPGLPLTLLPTHPAGANHCGA